LIVKIALSSKTAANEWCAVAIGKARSKKQAATLMIEIARDISLSS
jgi:hypothetical protein